MNADIEQTELPEYPKIAWVKPKLEVCKLNQTQIGGGSDIDGFTASV